MIRIKHKWGNTILTEDTELTHSIAMAVPTVARRFNRELKKLELEGDRAPIGDWLKMGEHALEFGLLDQFTKVMDRIEQKDKNNPSVVAYLKLKSSFEKEARIPADAKTWARKLQGSYKMSYSPHYVVLHTLTDNEGPEVIALKDQLEKNYKAFYYWFALKGKALPIPEYKLVTVMLSQETEFDKKHEVFDPSPLVDDGFFGQRDNLAFFSDKRLDQGYVALTEYTSEVLWKKGYDKEQMLKGKTKIKIPNTRDWADGPTIARVHTLALLEKALEEDGRRAAVTHEGTRQLIVSSDLVARGIALPRWIEFGMGSFFETPKSAPWSSTGAPHWIYLAQYKEWVKDKKLKDPTASLKSIVTDKDFLDTLKKKNKDKAKSDVDPDLKARTMAWSLTYFLAKNRLDDLLNYYQELGKLPRDLQFDEKTLLDCFARAFKLVDPTTKKLDEGKLGSLATDWHNYISSTPLEAERLMEEYKKTKKGDSKSGDGKSDSGKSGDDKP